NRQDEVDLSKMFCNFCVSENFHIASCFCQQELLRRITRKTFSYRETSREGSFARGPLGSGGTELYPVPRGLRLQPTTAGRLILIDLRRGEGCRREVSNVQKND